MNKPKKTPLGAYIDVLTDYHSNGSYETLKNHVNLLDEKDYAIMIRTLNFERNDFSNDLLYITQEAYEFLEKSKVYPNDILMNKIANPGSLYIMPDIGKKVSCGMNLFLIRFNNAVDQRYMYYCMKNAETYIKSLAHGTTTKTITKDEVKDIELDIFPSLNYQKQISKLLTTIDKKIEKNIEINDNLQQMVKTVYDYWFTQFDFPDKNGKPYHSSGGKMVYNEQLKREIPDCWKVKNLLSLVTWNGGSQPPKSEHISFHKPGYIRFIQNRDYADDNHLTYIPVSKNNKLCNEYDIMVDKYGEAGKTRFGIAGAFNVALSRIDVLLPDMQEFIRFYLESNAIKQYLSSSCMASTRASLNENNLSFLNVAVPPSTICKNFESFAKSIIKQILKNNEEIREVIKLRDWLLPMLMNGQATVSD